MGLVLLSAVHQLLHAQRIRDRRLRAREGKSGRCEFLGGGIGRGGGGRTQSQGEDGRSFNGDKVPDQCD